MVELVKRAALEAIEAAKPVNLLFGVVAAAAPLEVRVDQKTILYADSLVLARNVTDYAVQVTIDEASEAALGEIDLTHAHGYAGETASAGLDSHTHGYGGTTQGAGYKDLTHSHAIQGVKTLLIHNALKAGDRVLLARVQGGRKYVVLDRLGG